MAAANGKRLSARAQKEGVLRTLKDSPAFHPRYYGV